MQTVLLNGEQGGRRTGTGMVPGKDHCPELRAEANKWEEPSAAAAGPQHGSPFEQES